MPNQQHINNSNFVMSLFFISIMEKSIICCYYLLDLLKSNINSEVKESYLTNALQTIFIKLENQIMFIDCIKRTPMINELNLLYLSISEKHALKETLLKVGFILKV